jgi:hypothetical protein
MSETLIFWMMFRLSARALPLRVFEAKAIGRTIPISGPVIQLLLGNNVYDKEQLLSILRQPVRGNGLILLAHQLIAAKINSANGADASCIEQPLSDADALIGDLLVPPVGDGYLRPGDVSGLADILDGYNEGALCAPTCNH